MMVLVALVAAVIQTAPVAPPAGLQVEVPTMPGLAADPTCGGREGLNTIATCLATTQGAIEGVVEALNTDFTRQGWLAADGDDNRIVYVKRKAEGGCDAFQVLAFAGESDVSAPTEPAYLALAAIPGDICAAAPATPQ